MSGELDPPVGLAERPGERPSERVLAFRGRLDAETSGLLWEEALALVRSGPAKHLILDASEVQVFDASGTALFWELRKSQEERGAEFRLRGLRPEFERLLELYAPRPETEVAPPAHESLPVQLGRVTAELLLDFKRLVVFVGELTSVLVDAVRHPRSVRWKDVWVVCERAGADATPIVGVVCFLMGLIMAFQAAIPMRRFGADVFVADLVGLSMLRELGPLMTAIVLAGRSGSAFAAELGTMKVNEEIDALSTMGIDPVRFLVRTRVIAAVVVTPVLTVFANLMGLLGGLVVFLLLGFPLITYVNQLQGILGLEDLFSGLIKAFAFGLLVAAIGCLRGLQTGRGASSVGISTTRAVVSGIVLIAVTDGVFSVIYYALDI